MQLEKSNKEYKFNFFNKSVHRNFKKINIVCGLLVAVSAIFGVSQVAKLNGNIEPEGKMQFKVDEDKILSNLQDIDFNPDGEKMKKEIWKKFAVPVHFLYFQSDRAEFGFTYKGENYTAVIGQDKEGNSVYLPVKNKYLIQKN